MEGEAVGHNFERDPPRDHPCQVRFNLVQRFQMRIFKCESLRRTTDGRRRMPSNGKSSHDLWPGELKMKSQYVHFILDLINLHIFCKVSKDLKFCNG
jgi:hypothetical protein